MIFRHSLTAAALAALVGFGAPGLAAAHGPGGYGQAQPHQYGWHMQPGMTMPQMMPQMMQGCPMGGPHMMSPGMMGPGYGGDRDDMPMMRQGMPGPGMPGPGMGGPGMGSQGMGGGMMMQPSAVVSTDDVTRMLERRLAWQGNPHVKLGKVAEKGADTIVAEIVTQDGSLVERLEVDRRNGWMRMVP
jgi:hypothetical protein